MKLIKNSLLITLNLVILADVAPLLASPTTFKPSPSDDFSHVLVLESAPDTAPPNPSEPPEAKPKPTDDDIGQRLKRKLQEVREDRKFIEADKLYKEGRFAEAEKIYRQVKAPFSIELTETQKRPTPIYDPAQLSPAGKVYWREAEAGTAQKLQTRVMVPLKLLVEQYPEFIPGHLRLAQVLEEYDRSSAAIDVLERATTQYPNQPELVRAKVAALADAEKWMEASLAARQFALLNSNHPESPAFTQLADKHLKRYKSHLRSELRGNAIANVITGALGYAFTGSLIGPFSAAQTTIMLMRGETAVGKSVAKQAREQLEMVEDKEVLDYVNEIGARLAQATGRNDFKYEFYVVLEDDLNAFALPGGKVFVNAGAIAKTRSEAELAGLLAHELSHAVLSHGFQLVAEGNLTANVTQFIPLGNTLANIFTLNYSRDMERQADTLGTRLLTSTGYAADGLHNLLITLEKQEKNSPPSWLSSHPATSERVSALESLIQRNNYNRYAYEGVERHNQIKERVKKLLAEKEQQKDKKHHDD